MRLSGNDLSLDSQGDPKSARDCKRKPTTTAECLFLEKDFRAKRAVL